MISTEIKTPTVAVSWGELIDKITILEIKKQRLRSAEAVENVCRELAKLESVAQSALVFRPTLASLWENLKSLNEALWDIEDKIRAKESSRSFDQGFIDLARSVYIKNDERGRIKRQINILLNSELIEEKEYSSYSTEPASFNFTRG